MNCKKRLEEYIENDMIYQDYKENKLMNPSDFDKFCIQHCKDIEELLEENKQLKDNWNELKEYAKENLYFYSGYQGEDLETDVAIQGILDKMKELERSDK